MPTPPARRFKKFTNRKLYDLDGSSYVSMVGLAQVVAVAAGVRPGGQRAGLEPSGGQGKREALLAIRCVRRRGAWR